MRRYSRLISLKEIGEEGHKIIRDKNIAIIGLGALGTVAADLLIRNGIGNLLLIDRDIIEESNLTRQALFYEEDVGRSKVYAAKEKLSKINRKCRITAKPIDLNPENASILKEADLILDCTDNLETRYLINDFCRKEKIIWIFASAIKTSGYIMPIFPEGPCLNCWLKEKISSETCRITGVLNTITYSIAALQVNLALKALLQEKIESELLNLDIWNPKLTKIAVKIRENCPTCNGIYLYLNQKKSVLLKFCGGNKYQINGKVKNREEIEQNWKKIGKVIKEEHSLSFKNIILYDDGRALIEAESEKEAKAIYSKFVGN